MKQPLRGPLFGKSQFAKLALWGLLPLAAVTNSNEAPLSSSIASLSLEELLSLQVVAAASGYEQPKAEAPTAVTVINRSQWRAAGAKTLTDILPMVPGVHVARQQAGITTRSINIRGIAGSFGQQVLILIDGRPMRYLQNSGRFVNQRISLASFSRVEVIRSPGSAIYGADAVGGVINLVTETYDKNTLEAALGNFNSQQLAWRQKGAVGELNWQFSIDYQNYGDDPDKIITSDLQSNFDGIFATQASRAPGRLEENFELANVNVMVDYQKFSASVYYSNMLESGVASGVAQALDPDGHANYRFEQYRIGYSFVDQTEHRLDLDLGYNYQKAQTYLHVFPAGTTLPIGADGNVDFVNPNGLVTFNDGLIGTPSPRGSSRYASLTSVNQLGAHTLRTELGYEKQFFSANERKNFGPNIIDGSEGTVNGELTNVAGSEAIYVPNVQRELGFISIQDEWQLHQKVTALAGIRFDKYSDFGSTTNPRVSISWKALDALTVKSFFGTAFRPPSFVELYSQNNPAAIGDPTLGAEQAHTTELGTAFKLQANKNLFIESNVYHYHLKDIIEYVIQPESGLLISNNIGEQEGYGVELELTWRATKSMDIKGHISRLEAEDKLSGSLPGVPESMAYAQTHWRFADKWGWFINAKWIGSRARAHDDQRTSLEGYTWVNTRLAYKHGPTELAFFVDNVLDTRAKEPSNGSIPGDFPLRGRGFNIEFSIEF